MIWYNKDNRYGVWVVGECRDAPFVEGGTYDIQSIIPNIISNI